MDIYDGIIIGAGPAGLSAGIYLARFKKKTLIIDAETGRSMLPGTYGNIMGFLDPVERRHLRKLGADQAKRYGAEKVCGFVTDVKELEKDKFRVTTEHESYIGKNIIFCTGVKDNWPEIPDYGKYVGNSLHSCPICAGYESSGKKIITLGSGNKISGLALMMLTYSDKITIVTNGKPADINPEYVEKLNNKNIPIYTNTITKLIGQNNHLEKIVLDDGKELEADFIFTALGVRVKSELAQKIGVETNENGYIKVNFHQETNISGVYAAGDVTDFDSKQVVTGMYEGFMAAHSIYNKLLREDIHNI